MFGNSKTLDTESDWYDEIDPLSYYEKNLELTFLSKLNEVYPDFIGVQFSPLIETPSGETSKPDLAMIRKDYSEWIVVEIEMSRHSWDKHVDKQVRVFTEGIYPKKDTARLINAKDGSLDLVKLEKMVSDHQPRVLVVVNEDMPQWKKKAKKYKALVSTFQIYKGLNGLDIYRVSGDTPYIYRDKSHCKFVKSLSNTLEVHTPTFITEGNKEIIDVTFRHKKTKWELLRAGEKVYLMYKGRTNHLQLETKYLFYKSDRGNYYLELN